MTETSAEYAKEVLQLKGNFTMPTKDQHKLQYHLGGVVSWEDDMNMQGTKVSTYGCTLLLKRKLSMHVMETYVPTSLFLVASWISFLIPPEVVPGRMTLLVTLLLVQINLSLTKTKDAPRATTITALSLWNILCITQARFIYYR